MPLNETIYPIVFLIAAIAIYFIVAVITMRRNITKVVKLFEEKNALSAKTAISAADLNIKEQSFLEKAIKSRDNRPHALKFLLNGGVVITTGDQRLYLDKKKMPAFKNRLNPYGRMMIPDIDKWQ